MENVLHHSLGGQSCICHIDVLANAVIKLI